MIKFDARDILQYLIKHPKSCVQATNVTYAPKLFLLSSILNSIQNKYDAESIKITNEMLEFVCVFQKYDRSSNTAKYDVQLEKDIKNGLYGEEEYGV